MRAVRLFRSVIPAPRRRVGLRAALPLLVFLLVFAGACVSVELLGVVSFSSRKAFLLAAAMPWFWWMHVAGLSGLSRGRALLALLVRLTVVALLVALMAEPRAVRYSDVLSVVYVLDVSNSIGESASDAARQYVAATVSQKPERDEAGLVVFGRDAAVELPPRTVFPFEAINCLIVKDGTNLAGGLSLAAAVLPEDRVGRLVLISDGAQTEGALSGVLDELKSRDVAVDVLPVQYGYEHEVWLEKLELPRHVRAEETYEAAVVLSSLQAGSGRLVLLENGEPIYEGDVDFNAGKNRYVLPIYLREPGYYQYVARIDVPEGMDGWQENNKAVGHLYLKGEGKVLVVTDPNGDSRDWDTLVGALTRARFDVERVLAYELPSDPMSLMPYDCIIFVNVPADAFDVLQFDALRDAVYNQGSGFLMVGGQHSFGPGGYHRTAVEEVLPVSMDVTQKKILPKGALVIILHTCEFPQGNTWGKRIAKEAIRVLGAKDEVGVLVHSYPGGEGWLFNLTPAGEYERLVALINQAQIGDMPSFGTTMQMGLNALQASDAAMKHMIIISDGDPSSPTPELLTAFVAGQVKVSVSTVAINPHTPQDVTVMRAIAGATGGRYYFPQDPAQLPSIFIKEAKTLKRSMIQNLTFVPTVEAPSPVLKGVEDLRGLRGYVLTTPKGRALTILKGPETEQMDPVLATWRYGMGKSAAFTSDLSTNWAAEWTDWDRYLPFVKQLVNDISRTEREGHLQVRTYAAGGTGTILIEDTHPQASFLEIEASVKGPQGRVKTVRLAQSGAGRYEGRFPLWGKGRYQVVAVGAGDGRSESAVAAFAVPYSPEFLRFRADPIVLGQIAEATGGRVLTGNETGEDVFVRERQPRASSRPISDWFLVLLACLIPLDVGVRRIQLDWSLIRGWIGLGRGREPSGETLETLLRRKREIEFMTAQEDRRRALAERAARPQPPEGKAPAAPPAAGKEKADQEGLPTTRRLLEKRKRWRKE